MRTCLVVGVIVLTITALLPGCGGAPQPTTTPPLTQTAKPTTTTPTTTQPPSGNQPPVIKNLKIPSTMLTLEQEVLLICEASDADGDKLTYSWTSSGGTFISTDPSSNLSNWRAPKFKGEFTIDVSVSDGKGGVAKQSLKVTVQDNRNPVISQVTANPSSLKREETSSISCNATDPDNDNLTYAWEATGGTVSGSGKTVTWKAPAEDGTYTVKVKVDDGKGGTADGSVVITVKNPENVITLKPVAGESMSIDTNGGLNATFMVGDNSADAGVRTYLSFDLTSLSGLEIKDAILTLTAKPAVGNPWAFSGSPFFYIEPVDFGARPLTPADKDMPSAGAELLTLDSKVPDKLDVTGKVNQILFKGRFQIKMRMASNTNFNKQADYIEFSKIDLVVTIVK